MKNALDKRTYVTAALQLEEMMVAVGGKQGKDSEEDCPVNHSFGDGCYIREWNSPAGMLVVSKIHKVAHPYFVLEGDVSVITESGVERIKAPHYGITPRGTKRVLYTHAPTVWVTVHVTESTDVDEIEKQIICTDINDMCLDDIKIEELEA